MKQHPHTVQCPVRIIIQGATVPLDTIVLAVWASVAIAATPSVAGSTRGAQMVTAWNQAILSAAEKEDKFLTLKGVRTAAMAHLAMYQTANRLPAAAKTDKPVSTASGRAIAAATQAAYTIVAAQYPAQLSRR